MQIPPPRIFVITARDADAAVIFRRGPSNWFHLLKWDMADATFQAGAWFKGSMYSEKCDLSPDGTLLLYFVLRGSMLQTSYTHAWTAVSRAPWMEALGLWPQGMTSVAEDGFSQIDTLPFAVTMPSHMKIIPVRD
jgi:hypothetical protein